MYMGAVNGHCTFIRIDRVSFDKNTNRSIPIYIYICVCVCIDAYWIKSMHGKLFEKKWKSLQVLNISVNSNCNHHFSADLRSLRIFVDHEWSVEMLSFSKKKKNTFLLRTENESTVYIYIYFWANCSIVFVWIHTDFWTLYCKLNLRR